MPQIGAGPIPLKNPTGPWGGLTTLSKSAPFQFTELENCYVNSDGSELRMMPGWKCVIDPASVVRAPLVNESFGYVASHFMARRGVAALSSGYYFESAPSEQQIVWTRPTQMHCVEQVGGRWIFVGSSDIVREVIFNVAITAFVEIVSYDDAGGFVVLTLSEAPSTTANAFNALTIGDRILPEGLTGVLASTLNGKGHTVTNIVGAAVTLGTASGAITAELGQHGFISRVSHSGAASGVDPVCDDVESLTIWTSIERGNVDLLSTKVFPAHVMNRMRDFGDTVGVLKQGNANAATVNGGRSRRRQKSLPYRLVPHVAGNRLILVAPGYGCVFQAPCVIPSNFDGATAALGINSFCNDIYDMPRALGVPKAILWDDPDPAVATTAHIWDTADGCTEPFGFGGTDASVAGRDGVYQFKIGYRDDATGEVGLTSEPVVVTTTAAAVTFQGIVLFAYFPGYLLHESGALTINLYRTERNGTTFYFDRTITMDPHTTFGFATAGPTAKYGAFPAAGTTEYFHHVYFKLPYTTDEELRLREGVVPEVLEQMPMGCKTARTIRGFTIFGGALGNSGSRQEMQQGTLTWNYDFNSRALDCIDRYPDHIGSAFVDDFDPAGGITASFEGVETGFGCAARNIPPAYSGQIVVGQWFPFPRKMVRLNKLVNTDVGWSGAYPNTLGGRIQDVRYEVTDSPVNDETDLFSANARIETSYLMLPRARLQISEPDNPGVVPATNTTVLAAVRDDDVEAVGDANGQAVVCTRASTYSLAFSQSPIGTPPDIANDRFGCIAPNSMVTFEGGCAWISERGPVGMVGGVQFFGEHLERHFVGETRRYLRDQTGMMRHAWACHDAERSLIYFGVFANRAATEQIGSNPVAPLTVSYLGTSYNWATAAASADADKIRSLFPSDEVLIYSYRSGAWSVWRPPLNLGIQWMTRGVDANGIARVFFLDSENRLNVLDDTYGNGDKESFRNTIPTTGTLSTINIAPSGVRTWVGLTVAVYKEATADAPAVLRGVSEVVSQVAGVSFTMAAALDVTAGDIVIIGARTMRLSTTFFNLKSAETSRLANVGLRYQLLSRSGQEIGGSLQQAFASATGKTEIKRDGIPTTISNSYTTEGETHAYSWLGHDLPDDAVHELGLKLGSNSGANQQVSITIVGGAQVRLQDLYAEVQ